jgi:cysteine desulfurase
MVDCRRWKSIVDFQRLSIDFHHVNRRKSRFDTPGRETSHVIKPVYLDHNATTPTDPRVLEAMLPFFAAEMGNAGSRTHVYGQRAKHAVDRARGQVAGILGASSEEIIFTSGATESDNVALLGLMQHGLDTNRKHIVATAIEHTAVLAPLRRLQTFGFEVELVPVTSGGYIEPDAVRALLRPDTLVVSVMHANNETGVLQPVLEIGELLAGTETLFHVDAAQTYGKEVEALRCLDCDFLAISGHKIYGPKGIGALHVSRRVTQRKLLLPIMTGGGQEKGLRPGTLPVPLIVGLGAAAELAREEYRGRRTHAERLKRKFLSELAAVEHRINGDLTRMQAHVINVSFPGVDSEALMLALRPEIAISNGAACSSSGHFASHVLTSMGLREDLLATAVRLSWGPGVKEIPHEVLFDAVSSLRL